MLIPPDRRAGVLLQILDCWLGPRGAQPVAPAQYSSTAMLQPSRKVVRKGGRHSAVVTQSQYEAEGGVSPGLGGGQDDEVLVLVVCRNRPPL